MANTWPGEKRHAMTQSEHEAWNARNTPGTLQLCYECEMPTGRCEEDSIFLEPAVPDGSSYGPLCEDCCEKRMNWRGPAVG